MDIESNSGSAPTVERRGLLTIAGLGAFLLGCNSPALGEATKIGAGPILQPANPTEEAFIDRAFEMRQVAVDCGDQAYGAIIVRGNIIVGQSWSRVIMDQDPTGHAEMAAIRDAARRMNDRDLSGATLYSSSRPCPMCEAAAFWAGVGQMIHGRNLTKAGAPELCR